MLRKTSVSFEITLVFYFSIVNKHILIGNNHFFNLLKLYLQSHNINTRSMCINNIPEFATPICNVSQINLLINIVKFIYENNKQLVWFSSACFTFILISI